jgi:hypothetical protein
MRLPAFYFLLFAGSPPLRRAFANGLAEAASFFVARMSETKSGIEFDALMLSPDCASLIRATIEQNSGAKNAPRER